MERHSRAALVIAVAILLVGIVGLGIHMLL
jgi:preprotein translocase subunit Sss1